MISIPEPRQLPPRVEVDPILVALYVEETGHSPRVVTGFLTFDLEPPPVGRGFNAFESRVLDATAPSVAAQLGDDLA